MGGGIDLAREAELLSYDVVDRPVLEPLRGLVNLAAELLGVTMAEINVVSHDHTVHLATSDGHLGSVPAEHSFCSRTILREERTMIVNDAARHPVLGSSPYVDGSLAAIRSYLGTRLVTPRGVTIGTMCVWHDQLREFVDADQRTLESLADIVVSILELRRDALQTADSLQRLAASHRRVVRSNESLETFAGQVGHDLRTPLASLKLALSMLGDNASARDDEHAQLLTQRAASIVSRMEHNLNDLVDFAVLGGGVPFDKVDVAEVARAVLEDLGAAAPPGVIEVDDASLPVVLAYRTHVHAVLQNLLHNAVKYAGAQGGSHDPVVRVSGRTVGDRVRVEVLDRGPGVPVHLRPRVFDLSVRGEHPGQEGHGIGLATCSRLVDAMDGSIGVDERPGGGACFWFELPLRS